MNVLVLGAHGQLGTDLIATLRQSGCGIIAPTRSTLDVEEIEQLFGRLVDIDFDVLVNCSSYHKTDEVEDNASRAVAVNAHAVAEMAKACAAKRSRFFHISTDYVFGGLPACEPLDESASAAPVNVYGASKLLGESLARIHHEDPVILRVASLFGVAGASGKGGNFVETMIRLAREKGVVSVVNDQIMSPTYTSDIAQWIAEILTGVPGGVYHAVNTGEVSWYEFAKQIVTLCRIPAEVVPISSAEFPTRAARPKYSALSNRKLGSVLNRTPRPWQAALRDYLEAKGHV